MTFDGEYGPSTWEWVADQAEEYESSNGQRGNTLRDTGLPVIIMTTVGHSTGLVRKVPLMKVEHEGQYAIVASKGGAENHPGWYHNLMANSTVLIQDGPEPFETTVRLLSGSEREEWWERSVAAFAPYAEYKERADREIPLFITEPPT
ncbi:MAG: nitroreductase [marine actinobacterium MedAcidi-G3]|jgi:deazaflavin-dependent oxidoreductase (nitroreductase family)|nr:MAG: nitroreductase [marine actinobacterium MedAcidi-G3]MAR53373.1 nitroreductase family deazaflavin-dependent oxidoreductase [Acidimicrobiaceae bacterium]MBA4812080.1 nitroreductase family deazaflavin-dependent oxidoreductase [Acidimicrobiales bacterium]OUW86769.1 MAG: nitroreductase [Acidimicrobiaceae bacterium TMED224]MAR55310.1 nitroreductase family deazaflavin-dependent oxidoreductase [Acidimicrobiaceae bacterium]|tara:strand:- start:564 stop:1007 length:444 start_codon:yes stop_codon:yes gene_type:complete